MFVLFVGSGEKIRSYLRCKSLKSIKLHPRFWHYEKEADLFKVKLVLRGSGNKRADSAAKSNLNLNPDNLYSVY